MEDFDRMFENFFWAPGFAHLVPWTGARHALADVKDTGTEIVVSAELPGVSKEDLDIEVTEDGVEIRAEGRQEREETDEGFVYRERGYARWYRRLPFPAEVVPEKADAELRDGVLEVRVPKRAPSPERKARKVPVK